MEWNRLVGYKWWSFWWISVDLVVKHLTVYRCEVELAVDFGRLDPVLNALTAEHNFRGSSHFPSADCMRTCWIATPVRCQLWTTHLIDMYMYVLRHYSICCVPGDACLFNLQDKKLPVIFYAYTCTCTRSGRIQHTYYYEYTVYVLVDGSQHFNKRVWSWVKWIPEIDAFPGFVGPTWKSTAFQVVWICHQ